MKRILSILVLALAMTLGAQAVMAQGAQIVYLNPTTNATIVACDTTRSTGLFDDGGETADYTPDQDNYISFYRDCGTGRLCIIVTELDIASTDTIYIYDATDTNSVPLAKITNDVDYWLDRKVFVSPTNNTNHITIRFRVKANSLCGSGFNIAISCDIPCESIEPVIDDMFYRTRGGVVYDTAYLKQIPVYDTTFNIVDGDTLGVDHVDTNYFTGANLCVGDGVIFHGHGNYTFDHGYYTPSDATTTFQWSMGTFTSDAHVLDTIIGVGVTEVPYNGYQNTGCYDVVLAITDAFGCTSRIYTSIRVRTALNPIKTIFTLDEICNIDSLMVNMGYDGENATLTLKKIEQVSVVSKTNDVRTFIPDGQCPVAGQPAGVTSACYEAPVTFTEFPASRIVQSANDICSICINMEHTYMGDLTVSIICPSGNEAYFFFGNQDASRPRNGQNQDGSDWGGNEGGGGKYMGYPIENDGYDGSVKCDSIQNPFGVGLDYCFTRNYQYTLVTGDNADIAEHPVGDFYITSNGFMDPFDETLPAIPSYFNHGGETPHVSATTKHPSNHAEKSDYYLPFTDFTELVGCPLNGTWAIKVCDYWMSDNGWVFNWAMDICDVSKDNDCKYEVGIDSLIWRPKADDIYHDYDLGHYRGLVVNKETPSVSWISSPDTAGVFPIDVLVYDEFGCVWDTVTSITTFWTPIPDLGPDTGLCGDTQMKLSALDRHAATEKYSYLWSPFGQTDAEIMTQENAGNNIDYVVKVINTRGENNKKCEARDTINVKLRRQPLPSFIPEPFNLEGCAPLTLTFNNKTIDGDRFLWDFGDGITSALESPTHTFDEGIYDLKYYVYSEDGCIDSLIMPQTVAAFSAPKAAFSWEPTFPSMLQPQVQFTNLTTPRDASNKYFWEIQYSQYSPFSVQTLTQENPSFDFSTYADDEQVAGNYAVRLISRSDNIAPSGNIVYCPDTAENAILVINDFLQFPNVVTPNGDGINDMFIIKGLVDGMGYPINSLDIYNKWGTRVYHKENISKEEDFWDPSSVPSGTYFYRFSARGYNGNVEHNGAIEVIKD